MPSGGAPKVPSFEPQPKWCPLLKVKTDKHELQVWLVRWAEDGSLLVYGVTEDIDLVADAFEKTKHSKWSDPSVRQRLIDIGIPVPDPDV